MIEDFKELDFSGLDEEKDLTQQISDKLKEQLGLSLEDLTARLSTWLQEHAEELTHDFVNVAPYEQYDKLLDNNDAMAEFFKTEAHKPENWSIHYMGTSQDNHNLLEVIFNNTAVDDGDSLKGYVFVSKSGKIRHAFAQSEL